MSIIDNNEKNKDDKDGVYDNLIEIVQSHQLCIISNILFTYFNFEYHFSII